MAQQVQELIDKIKSEGIQQAEVKAQEIEKDAKQKAEQIVADAQTKAKDIIAEAEKSAAQLKESGALALEQSARNMLISLRKDIEVMLRSILQQKAGEALTGESLVKIMESAVTQLVADKSAEIVLNEEQLKALNNSVLASLQKKLGEKVEFKASSDVGAGFVIVLDKGKTNFEFTDASLAEFLSAYLNEEVAGILKKAVN